jgi:hypothetical protein
MRRFILVFLLLTLIMPVSPSQELAPVIKGTVTDSETGQPLAGAYIREQNQSSPNVTVTDADGKFRLSSGIGRVSILTTYIGYEDLEIKDILVASGKEVNLDIPLREKIFRTSDVIVSSSGKGISEINQISAISATAIRTDDALRFAGGFYDPSRIVNSFAGVVTSNSDYSNDIVIRGNSSRGLLWRLEGIEIPNPNHFSDGQGGSGGAFSAITSNVVANFEFFTGAFPAEFGNAFSGVVDLSLKKGNSDRREYAFQTGMIGAEGSLEGPFKKGSGSTYLLNVRFTNFKILNDLGLIDLEETNYSPRTKDLVFNFNFPLEKSGTINLFGVFGSSGLGKIAVHDPAAWTTREDMWEESEDQNSTTIGVRYLYPLKNSKTYLRTVLAYTTFSNSYSEGYIDSTFNRINSYWYDYSYPSGRFSTLVNHKINSKNTIRAGFDYNFLSAELYNFRINSSGKPDTLVSPYAEGSLFQNYIQWKYRPFSSFEIISGLHLLAFTKNRSASLEPRLGIRWQVLPGMAFIAGFGLHSKTESFYVYNSLIKTKAGIREPLNSNLDNSKSTHWIAGLDLSLSKDLHARLEGYIQNLFNIPIVNNTSSQYSSLNAAERLPEAVLENKGTGNNSGLELTLEKAFTKNYYFLVTGSLFNSWYKAGDLKKYNTYYNTKYVSNILLGKDFYIGKNKANIIGLNAKWLIRGGYRYTPVDMTRTLKLKRIIYNAGATYESQLPVFYRLDAGINFRKNHPGYSWIVMLDIQNATDRKNVFRKRFSYNKGSVIENNILSLGIVPVFNFRIEF